MLASPYVLYSPIMIDVSRSKRIAGAARALRGWGLGSLAAALLADGGPLPFLGAQALYFGAPVLGALAPGADLEGLAGLLEDPEAVRALARRLSEAA
jgi:hypothetical protein